MNPKMTQESERLLQSGMFRLRLALTGVMALSACGTAYQTLRVDDRAFIPAGRISKSLYRADRTLAPSDVQTELTVDGGFVGGSGSSPLPISQNALVGSQTFTAPQTLDVDADFINVDASIHWRQGFFQRRFGYDVFTGFAGTNLDFQASSPAGQGKDSISSPALRLGGGAFVRILKGTSVEVEGTVLGTNHNFTGVNGYRFSLVQKLGKHLAVNGGYSSWNVESASATASRLELHLRGPAAGLQVKF